MDLTLDDAQLALQDTARRFTAEQIVPIAPGYDQSGEFPRGVIEHTTKGIEPRITRMSRMIGKKIFASV